MRLAIRLRLFIVVSALVACAQAPQAQSRTAHAHELTELWEEPGNLLERDLLAGPGGAELAPPDNGGSFEFLAFKTAGTNRGYEVKDASGRVWSVKLGIEAQTEVTSSRILWAMGFHQPAQYFVHEFTLNGGDTGVKTNARFRTDLDKWESAGEWSWYENPFLGAVQFRGLIVTQLILNNWDLKTTNNRIYRSNDGSSQRPQLFMVRDVGASLGYAKQFPIFKLLGTVGNQGSKNDLDGFERQGFITSVDGAKVTFDYRGPNQGLIDRITAPDVIWACEQLAKLPDGHLQAAFKAGGFPQDKAERYIKKIKDKIAQGLALKPAATP